MKNALILLAITIILVGVCGCTQTAPPVQPMTTVTYTPANDTTADGNNHSSSADNEFCIR